MNEVTTSSLLGGLRSFSKIIIEWMFPRANKGMQATAYSVRSSLASASRRA